MTLLRAAAGDAPFIFVAGKGGTGKTTTAAALALQLADAGTSTHIISTDPAHSLRDVLDETAAGAVITSHCAARLQLEEFDADRYADAWLQRALGPVTEIVERGTYLDAEDVAGFTRLALPGLDEMMAVLRLVDLATGERTVVVDTAPTGHTLRLLDAVHTHEGMSRALRAMADKARVVASSFARRPVRLSGEHIIDELERYVHRFRDDVLARAAFVLVTRADDVVRAETVRLALALRQRQLRIAATVHTAAAAGSGYGTEVVAPVVPRATGCAGLRAWATALIPAAQSGGAAHTVRPARSGVADATARTGSSQHAPSRAAVDSITPALPWLEARRSRMLLFAGKGGVGKTTCAAATALALARGGNVLLCSADPAGSLDDVLATRAAADTAAIPQLRVLQIDAERQLARLREQYRADVLAALERIGLTDAAALDRRVIDALWELTPPGIDEFAALAALLDAAGAQETIVLDTAPTGHFLRLLTMPQVALDWVRQLMRIMVKYRASGEAGGAAEALLQSSRELRALQELLHDPQRAGVFVVTLDEPIVQAETERLLRILEAAAVPVAAVIHNRVPAPQGAPALQSAAMPGDMSSTHIAGTIIVAPELATSPVGADALREFVATWNIVT